MDDLDFICLICGNELIENVVVVTNGISAISEASKKRKDSLHTKVLEKSSIKLHKSCRQQYTRPSSIQAAVKKLDEQHNEPSTSTTGVTRRSHHATFDFKMCCFICGKSANVSSKTPVKYRKAFHEISTIEFKDNFLNKCDIRNDEWGETVKARILSTIDLVAAESRYHKQCYTEFTRSKSSETQKGRPKTKLASTFDELCKYIEQNDECQYTLKEVQDIFKSLTEENEVYSDKHLKSLLQEHFKERLTVTNVSGRKNVLCLTDNVHKIMDQWYKSRDVNPEEERKRIVLAAASIIREDIQKKSYDFNSYPDLEAIKTGGKNLIPETLDIFTSHVTKKKNMTESQRVDKKCLVINHAIVSAVRPRSFLSPIQTSLALTLHRLYGSKHLINMLSTMGVCSSYNEATIYSASLVSAGSPNVEQDGFIQHVFDNADVNVRTLDGLGTFHAMGGIQCITPGSCVKAETTVQRISAGSFCNTTSIREYAYPLKKRNTGLSKMIIKDLNEIEQVRSVSSFPSTYLHPYNYVWLSDIQSQPGWSGFMTNLVTSSEECQRTYIMAVPFINLDPSNMSTIYTALQFAADQSKTQNQTCIVTFDQPLFLKAIDIVAASDTTNNISKIVVRLGGFHLLMSYMGAVGKIMEGSGLTDLWSTVYGKATVNHMMNGHAYDRCLRAFTLTAAALMNIAREIFPNIQHCFEQTEEICKQVVSRRISTEDALNDPLLTKILHTLDECLQNIEKTSRTAKLWVRFLKKIDLALRFVYAERTGDWNLHLRCTTEMLPYFHASGHLPYAKSAHIYAQEMTKLSDKLSEREYDLFTNKGYFTVKRTSRYWSGTWTDMCIEQCLMRPMKSVGGLTHGRGVTESTISKWILETPYFIKINEALEEFLDISIIYSEQHVQLRKTRRIRDNTDIDTFTKWFRQHNPFNKESGELVSLSSGFISDESVNCDIAYEIGCAAMKKMAGKPFGTLTLKRKDMVKTQLAHTQIKVRSKEIAVNSQQLFNRILCVCDSQQKLRTYLEYELSSRPPSLFDDVSLRKGTKSSAIKIFEYAVIEEEAIDRTNVSVIIDGGFLIHYVSWPKDCNYGCIIQCYSKYVLQNFGRNVTVVFDGYPEDCTTKQEEQNRRAAKHSSSDISFDSNTRCMTAKEDFLGNKRNKKRLILLVAEELTSVGIITIIAEDDADISIVMTSIEELKTRKSVVVYGTDTDLLMLLVAIAPENQTIYFCKQITGRLHGKVYYDISNIIHKVNDKRKLMMFAYAITGCDTTSAFFGVGKLKAMEIVQNSQEAQTQASLFICPNASKEDLKTNGEKFILALYGQKKHTSLNEARYFMFTKLTNKSKLRSNFALEKLPPTSEAAHQHLFRVYLQVQTWLGNTLEATDWGWKIDNIKENGSYRKTLTPILSSKPFAPDDLLHLVSCSCKTACLKYCGCRKVGLNCSAMCEQCNGLSCDNSPNLDDIIDDTDDFSVQ